MISAKDRELARGNDLGDVTWCLELLRIGGLEPPLGRAPEGAAHSGVSWSCKTAMERDEWSSGRPQRFKGVSTRDAAADMREFGIPGRPSSSAGRVAKPLDEELEAWRKRIGKQLRSIQSADDPARAQAALAELLASYRNTAPKPAK